jgi:hypothetical protein
MLLASKQSTFTTRFIGESSGSPGDLIFLLRQGEDGNLI